MKYTITITKNKDILGGQWRLADTRISLEHLLDHLDKGWDIEQYKSSYGLKDEIRVDKSQ